jgi:hypothetical protein
MVYDSDRAWYSPSVYYDETTTRCDVHKREHEEFERQRKQAEHDREECRVKLAHEQETHRASLRTVAVERLVPLKRAVERFQYQVGDTSRTSWIIRTWYSDILHATKVNNRWKVSENHLDRIDFALLERKS